LWAGSIEQLAKGYVLRGQGQSGVLATITAGLLMSEDGYLPDAGDHYILWSLEIMLAQMAATLGQAS
jgi:hypothetical protein